MRTARPIAAAVFAAAVMLLGAAPASAHIEPEPGSVPALTPATVAFVVEHGCDGSATTEVAIQVPEGITEAEPEPKDGWTTATAGGVVTWTGGPLPDDQPDRFELSFIAPDAEGQTLAFPLVQTCQQGELAWIDTEGPDTGSESENPAPTLEITAAPAAETTTAPSTTAAPSTTQAPATTEAAAPPVSRTANTDDGGSSDAPLVISGIVALVVVVAGGLAFRRWQRAQA